MLLIFIYFILHSMSLYWTLYDNYDKWQKWQKSLLTFKSITNSFCLSSDVCNMLAMMKWWRLHACNAIFMIIFWLITLTSITDSFPSSTLFSQILLIEANLENESMLHALTDANAMLTLTSITTPFFLSSDVCNAM